MRGDLQVSHNAEMIACPDSGNSLVEDAPAVSNSQSGSVDATSDHDVIDPPAHDRRSSGNAWGDAQVDFSNVDEWPPADKCRADYVR